TPELSAGAARPAATSRTNHEPGTAPDVVGANHPKAVSQTKAIDCPSGADFCTGVTERYPDQWLKWRFLERLVFPLIWDPADQGRRGTEAPVTTCQPVAFTITGIAPGQAPGTTAISRTPRAAIPTGGVAIKPLNF